MHLTSVHLCPDNFPTRQCYPFNLPVFQQTQSIALTTPVTFFVGENGSGKSTLLEAITQKCGIHMWQGSHRRGFEFNPHEKTFYRFLKIQWKNGPVPGSFFGSSTFQYFARVLDEWAATDPGQLDYFGGRSLTTLSHGQSLMAFFRNRYRSRGLYLLDEPETALSPKSQLALLKILEKAGQGDQVQFIIATHSPLLLACPEAVIYDFDEDALKQIDYEDTSHYQIYKNFMKNRNKYLSEKSAG
jgi:predicted ATPase